MLDDPDELDPDPASEVLVAAPESEDFESEDFESEDLDSELFELDELELSDFSLLRRDEEGLSVL